VTATKLPIKIAIVGVGKIARDQHVPTIAKDQRFELAATVSSSGGLAGVENFATIEDLLASRPDIPAVSLCMPPVPRFLAAKAAIAAGRHVMLEKPPGATVAEVFALQTLAQKAGITLYTTWHSRYANGVATARERLSRQKVHSVRIDWKEDVRKWHPGQDWIWEPGGVGVFDPGINALSILTAILPVPVHLTEATLSFPQNRATPIAADLSFTDGGTLAVTATFDWRHEKDELWQICVETDGGSLRLTNGGAKLSIDGADHPVSGPGEYPALYDHFTHLLATGTSDVDPTPLIHVADAFMLGRHVVVESFYD
jgi:D-galactose 1-dehydrogenase